VNADISVQTFVETKPSIESYWRGVILFGRNVASYKFALGKALLEFVDQGREVVTLHELAEPYARRICEHLKAVDKQGTFQRSRFLDACRAFNGGELNREALVESTVRLGFANVIDAFHVVNQANIPASRLA
jgi:hypothetical protein